MSAPGVIIAAPASGSGKTTVTLALLRALRTRGLKVGSFKVGPDYIDPVFHTRASGRICPNLDSWAMRIETLSGLGDRVCTDVDLVIGEGVMGLFDGALIGQGSTADLASLFDMPVVLVVDAGRMGASAAALVEGFINHREDVDVAGIIFNRVASEIHADLLKRACDDHFSQPVIGCLPTSQKLELPSRHLGLVQADEKPSLESFLDEAAAIVAEHLDLEQFQRLARPFGLGLYGPPPCPLRPLGQRIAVAEDLAFAFAYPAVLEGWRQAGAEVFSYSPLNDEAPPEDADAVYLPGGYPELHAGKVGRKHQLSRRAEARRCSQQRFIYGECGGFMVLGRGAGGQGWRSAISHGRPSARFDQLREAQTPSRLSDADAAAGLSLGSGGHDLQRPRVSLRLDCRKGPVDEQAVPVRCQGCARVRIRGCRGSSWGRSRGSFMHVIDRVAEPSDGDFSPMTGTASRGTGLGGLATSWTWTGVAWPHGLRPGLPTDGWGSFLEGETTRGVARCRGHGIDLDRRSLAPRYAARFADGRAGLLPRRRSTRPGPPCLHVGGRPFPPTDC